MLKTPREVATWCGFDCDPPAQARRLRLLCDTYDAGLLPADILPVAVQRLHDLAAFTEAYADEGREKLRGHVELYRRDAKWITANVDHLRREPARVVVRESPGWAAVR